MWARQEDCGSLCLLFPALAPLGLRVNTKAAGVGRMDSEKDPDGSGSGFGILRKSILVSHVPDCGLEGQVVKLGTSLLEGRPAGPDVRAVLPGSSSPSR